MVTENLDRTINESLESKNQNMNINGEKLQEETKWNWGQRTT